MATLSSPAVTTAGTISFLGRIIVSPLGERFLFTGDGVAIYRQQIADCLGDRVRFAAAPCAYLRPAAVAALAARDADKAVDYLTLQPLYLRAPQAERERAAREAKQHG